VNSKAILTMCISKINQEMVNFEEVINESKRGTSLKERGEERNVCKTRNVDLEQVILNCAPDVGTQ
jgi:hypothetical protein